MSAAVDNEVGVRRESLNVNTVAHDDRAFSTVVSVEPVVAWPTTIWFGQDNIAAQLSK
jgi:hypothetical protein